MNLVTLLLIGFLNFLAPSKEPLCRQHYPPGLTGTLIDLARLAKGRILVCFMKEGMTVGEVHRILGFHTVWSMSNAHDWSFWPEYGIGVAFDPPIAFEGNKYDPRVISVSWSLPSKYECGGFWIFQKDKFEDLRKIEKEWERIWFTDGSKPERVHGGIE